MSEEVKTNESAESGWSGLKKTLVGTIGTIVTAGGVWLSTLLGGHHEAPKEEPKTQTAAPAAQTAAPITINLSQNQENKQQQKSGGTTTIIKEVEKPSASSNKVKEEKKKEEDPW